MIQSIRDFGVSSRQRALIGALQQAEGREEKAGGEMNGVVAGVKFDEARDNDERGVFSDDCAQEADHEVAGSKRDAELLPYDGPGTHGHSEQDQPQDDVRQVMCEAMVMVVVAAGNVEEGQNAESHIQNARDNQDRFPSLAPHASRYASPGSATLD